MVLTYFCQQHGHIHQCDTSESGERICPECGLHVNGVTGKTRGRNAPPKDEPSKQIGSIWWFVEGWNEGVTIKAFDYIDAIETANEKYDNLDIRGVKPQLEKYRSF